MNASDSRAGWQSGYSSAALRYQTIASSRLPDSHAACPRLKQRRTSAGTADSNMARVGSSTEADIAVTVRRRNPTDRQYSKLETARPNRASATGDTAPGIRAIRMRDAASRRQRLRPQRQVQAARGPRRSAPAGPAQSLTRSRTPVA